MPKRVRVSNRRGFRLTPKEYRLTDRLHNAHKSLDEMNRTAGKLLEEVNRLKQEIAARDWLIAQLKAMR